MTKQGTMRLSAGSSSTEALGWFEIIVGFLGEKKNTKNRSKCISNMRLDSQIIIADMFCSYDVHIAAATRAFSILAPSVDRWLN